MIHIYTGDGRGKTTLAIGMGLRAKVRGKRVFAMQFSDTISEKERKEIPFEIHQVYKVEKPYCDMTDDEKRFTAIEAKKGLTLCNLMCKKCDLLIMDEVFSCVESGFIKEEEIVSFVEKLPDSCELVMTGEKIPQIILDKGDYVSSVSCLKEP